ncbi:SDR family NAD(P)-dependent oxidoreductase [Streptomyces sp. HC44]|uniref:SDR family NAD(P)-dependent oxidoreductase n=1 Tax=Streptomyces scabichelini TaxID=2711217 RepID=A0A6G4UYS1_9ACTN|nr:SDR family NAD(P)-dependent oxidoreductase [Streptomyces scabichelini]NGO06876.1 SDR family NAD(P)-dependent oxidoreductase [Streptomyces scabichelini]
MSSTGLQGRSVIVTGAGSGIGRATALKFAEEGAKVLVADVNQEGAEQTVETIEKAGGTARAVIGDLRDQQVIDEIVDTAVQAFGGLDVLVNNAGVMDRMSALGETDDDEWDRVIQINLNAPFRLTRAALPHMLAANGGAIVFTASEAALRGSAAGAAYTASKHGIVGLTKSLAVMYRNVGIRANAIAPGGTATNMRPDVQPDAHGPDVISPYIGLGLGDKISAPENQAAAIVFLASDAASSINGAVLPVDNGWSAV